MSQPLRFKPANPAHEMVFSPDGNWVAFGDYQQVEAENDRLKAEVEAYEVASIHTCSRGCQKPGCPRKYLDEIADLKAEVERLTGDIEVYREGVHKSDNLLQSDGIFLKDDEWVSDGIAQLIEQRNKAKDEVERLTKAGDEMDAYLKRQDGTTNGMLQCRQAWLASKEGKQP